MTHLAFAFLAYISSFLRSRHDLGLEVLALRQQNWERCTARMSARALSSEQ